MPAKKKPTPIQFCQNCGEKLERKRLPNGDLEYLIHFKRRKYCNAKCFAAANTGQKKEILKWSAAHRRARAICPPGSCVKCGKLDAKDVHHVDGNWNNNSIINLQRICRGCHNKVHRQRGLCVICGKPQKGLGYCDKHYQRFKRWGDPLMVKQNQYSTVRASED